MTDEDRAEYQAYVTDAVAAAMQAFAGQLQVVSLQLVDEKTARATGDSTLDQQATIRGNIITARLLAVETALHTETLARISAIADLTPPPPATDGGQDAGASPSPSGGDGDSNAASADEGPAAGGTA